MNTQICLLISFWKRGTLRIFIFIFINEYFYVRQCGINMCMQFIRAPIQNRFLQL
nr:MAG TPA: hypothetical protein [Caudoviricetes sp.]